MRLKKTLARLTFSAEAGETLMPLLLDVVRADASVGEIANIFRKVYGSYRERVSF